MKTRPLLRLLAAAALVANAPAATVIPDYENPGPDGTPFSYQLGKVNMSTTDSWSDAESVGGWSFRDLRPDRNQNRGWGHFSAWVLLELTAETSVSISMGNARSLDDLSGELVPDMGAWAGFVVYAGESVSDNPGEFHTYSNNGNDQALLNDPWDKNGPGGTRGLTYVGNGVEATQSTTASGTWVLGPGLYTIGFGNVADSGLSPTDKTFDFNITTVPEPSAALLSILAAGALGLRRRRA